LRGALLSQRSVGILKADETDLRHARERFEISGVEQRMPVADADRGNPYGQSGRSFLSLENVNVTHV
jgi:hypothetical protein